MENAATDDTSRPDAGEHGHDCGGGGRGWTVAQDSVQSASTVTEVGSSSNAAAAETRRPGLDDGRGEDYGWLTVLEKNAVDDDYYDPVEAELMAAGGGVQTSPARLAATRFGWLLLGFLAGAATAVLFLMRHDSPVTTCTVVPT